MDPHYWRTDYPHDDNNQTMAEFLDHEMDDAWKILMVDGTYAEVELPSGAVYEVHAGGAGDPYHHVAEFVAQ